MNCGILPQLIVSKIIEFRPVSRCVDKYKIINCSILPQLIVSSCPDTSGYTAGGYNIVTELRRTMTGEQRIRKPNTRYIDTQCVICVSSEGEMLMCRLCSSTYHVDCAQQLLECLDYDATNVRNDCGRHQVSYRACIV